MARNPDDKRIKLPDGFTPSHLEKELFDSLTNNILRNGKKIPAEEVFKDLQLMCEIQSPNQEKG